MKINNRPESRIRINMHSHRSNTTPSPSRYSSTAYVMSLKEWLRPLLTCVSGPLFVVVEFAPHGNLRQFLRERRPSEYQQHTLGHSGPSLTMRDFVSYAFQIARGMEYLGTRKV